MASKPEKVRSLLDVLKFITPYVTDLEADDDVKARVQAHLENQVSSRLRHCPRVCLLGESGSGKTSLTNALLGVDLLPSGNSDYGVTSTVVEISHDKDMEEGVFNVTCFRVTQEGWEKIKQLLVEVLSGSFKSGDFEEVTEELNELAKCIFKEAFPELDPEDVNVNTRESNAFLKRLAPSQKYRGDPERFESAAELKTWLAKHVDLSSSNSNDKIDTVLTQCVRISGNFPRIPEDVVLADLPGLEDSNILRTNSAERYFGLQCTHAWFCMPKDKGRLRASLSLPKQIRVLARAARLSNILLVRTKADKDPRKSEADLDRDARTFQKLCIEAQDGLDLPKAKDNVIESVQVTTAPAANGYPAEEDIAGVEKVLRDLGQKQARKARQLTKDIDKKIEEMLSQAPELDQKAASVTQACRLCQIKVQEFADALAQMDAEPAKKALLRELTRAKLPSGQILRAVIAKRHNGFTHKSRASGRSGGTYNLPQTVMSAFKIQDRTLESVHMGLMKYIQEQMESLNDLPEDLAESFQEKVQEERQEMNVIMATNGEVCQMLEYVLSGQLGGTGFVDKFIQHAETLWESPNGMLWLHAKLKEMLAQAATRLLEELEELAQDRLGGKRKKAKKFRRFRKGPPDTCHICLSSPQVMRAEHVQCTCKVKVAYACAPCARQLDNQRPCAVCPLCRGEASQPGAA